MRSNTFILIIISLMFSSVTIAEITEVGQCDTPGSAEDVFIQGNYAYVGVGVRGISVIDISDPENPDLISTWDNPRDAIHAVHVLGDRAYATSGGEGIYSVDISNPENLELDGHFDTRGTAVNLFVSGEIAYVTNEEYGLRFIDISDPGNLNEIGFYDSPGNLRGVQVIGELAYTADGGSGFRIIDVSDPENPESIGNCDTPEFAWQVAVSGNYAYVADGDGGLRIIDVSDPENPDEVGHSEMRSARDIFLSGSYVFIVNYSQEYFFVIDVSDPEEPEVVESFNTGTWAMSVTIVDNLAYIANHDNGLLILDVTEYIYTGPRIEVSDEILDFEEVGLNLSREMTVNIDNVGREDLTISDISIVGDYFSVDFEDEIVIEPDDGEEIVVTFFPVERGEFEGTLTITSNDEENSEIEVTLRGEGIGAIFYVHPRALDFDVVGIDSSDTKTLSIRNQGLIDLVISEVNNQSEYFITDFEDEITLEPDARHTLSVTFTPTQGIAYSDTLILTTNDPDNETVTVPMSGRGIGAVIVVDPDTVQFNEVGINQNAERIINISNDGETNLTISEIFVESLYFSIDLDTIYVVEPEGSLECTVTFSPTEIGDFNVVLFISCDDRQREEVNIPLFGTGKGPEIAVDSDSLDFGLLPLNENKELILTISAVGLTDLTVTDVSIEGDPAFSVEFNDEVFIELDNSFELPVRYNPRNDGVLTGVITIHSDDPENGEYEIHLMGTAHHGIMIDTLGTISDLTIIEDLMYLTTQNGLLVLDISNPEAPEITGTYHVEELNAISVFVEGDLGFITTGDDGFAILDVSLVDSIQFVSSYDTEGYARDLIVNDGYAFVADGEAGLRVIDLYDPERPFEVNHVDTPGEAYAVTIAGDYAYVANYVHGLRIIDISNPQEPEEVGYYNTLGRSMDVVISGDFAFVADERYGLIIIDISEPESPDVIGIYDTEGDASGVHVVGDHAYVADGDGGMYMLDISVPEAPSPAKIFYTPGIADAVYINDNYAFIADRSDLLIVDVSEFLSVDELTEIEIPDGFILQPAFPNPFNAVTSIRYGLPYA
ncbi:MAG: choice-of-anchor D domain-containing protein, partial [Calditrichaeota bacterium]|nr:choice-of-anchor D domain-containing protein [Calditrichota bacterium]